MNEVERRVAMLFPILSGMVVILGGIFCRLCSSPKSFTALVGAMFTGALSSYLFFHFYIWKDTFVSNLLYGAVLVTLFSFGILCGKTITESLHKKIW
jgi:hypothetical protein